MPAGNRRVLVSEIFGPTFQGEGPNTGKATLFLRLSGCNLSCIWCDTKYTWDWKTYNPKEEVHSYTPDEVLQELDCLSNGKISSVVVTGGEPFLQISKLMEIFKVLKAWKWNIEIETSGSVAPPWHLASELMYLVDRFNVSPKLHHSGNSLKERYNERALRFFWNGSVDKVAYKFVVAQPSDLEEINDMYVRRFAKRNPIYIMPEGRDGETLKTKMKELTPHVLAKGWNMSNRLHVDIFGDERGK